MLLGYRVVAAADASPRIVKRGESFVYVIRDPRKLSHHWPSALKTRIESGFVNIKKATSTDAIGQFNVTKQWLWDL